MKHIIFYIVVSILFVSVFSCKQRKNMQYLPFFYMKNYEVMHSKKYISIRENEYSDIDDTGFVWNLYNKNGEYYLKEYGKSMIFMTTKRMTIPVTNVTAGSVALRIFSVFLFIFSWK